jgi:hypothetical protein
LFEGDGPRGHAIVEFSALFRSEGNECAVVRAFGLILHHGVLVRRDAGFFRPERRARRAVRVLDIAGPISIGIVEVKATGKIHARHFYAEFLWQQFAHALDRFEIGDATVQQKYPNLFAVGAARNSARILWLIDDNADVPLHFQLVKPKYVFADLNGPGCHCHHISVQLQRLLAGDNRLRLPARLGRHESSPKECVAQQ